MSLHSCLISLIFGPHSSNCSSFSHNAMRNSNLKPSTSHANVRLGDELFKKLPVSSTGNSAWWRIDVQSRDMCMWLSHPALKWAVIWTCNFKLTSSTKQHLASMRGLIGQNCLCWFRLFEPIFLYNFALGLEFRSQYISVLVSVSMAFHCSAASKNPKTRHEVCVTVQKIAGCMCCNLDNCYGGIADNSLCKTTTGQILTN